MKLGFVGGSFTARSLAAAAQTAINVYVEPITSEDPNENQKNKYAMYGDPGYKLFVDLSGAGLNPMRGLWSGGGRVFAAGGTKYCEVFSDGSHGTVYTISNATVYGYPNSPVQFFPNGNQLFIVSGGVAYVDNGTGPTPVTSASYAGVVNAPGGALVVRASGDPFNPSWTSADGVVMVVNGLSYTVLAVLSPDVLVLSAAVTGAPLIGVNYTHPGSQPIAVTGGFLDTFYMFNVAFSRQVDYSAVNDKTGAVWNTLDSFTKDSWPDHIRSILVSDEQVYLFGDETFEVWQLVGTGNSPFQRIDGATNRVGSISVWGPISINGRVYFVGGSSNSGPVAYVLNGFTPVRCSTHAEESAWNAAGLGMNCVSFQYTEEGHTFWVINFGAQTWVYDTTTGVWHQRRTWNGADWGVYPMKYHTFIPEWGSGKHLVCGPADGMLYEASVNIYDNVGQDIKWERALPHLYAEGKRQYFGRMTLEMQTGTVPSGAAPNVVLDYSDDRGNTFINPRNASLGTAGQNSVRVFWPSNGSSYDRVFRLSGIGKGKVALIDLELEVEQGLN